jgi:hypothetical protein
VKGHRKRVLAGSGIAAVGALIATALPAILGSRRAPARGRPDRRNPAPRAGAHGMTLSDEEALLLAFRAELNEEAPTAIPRRTSAQTDEEER